MPRGRLPSGPVARASTIATHEHRLGPAAAPEAYDARDLTEGRDRQTSRRLASLTNLHRNERAPEPPRLGVVVEEGQDADPPPARPAGRSVRTRPSGPSPPYRGPRRWHRRARDPVCCPRRDPGRRPKCDDSARGRRRSRFLAVRPAHRRRRIRAGPETSGSRRRRCPNRGMRMYHERTIHAPEGRYSNQTEPPASLSGTSPRLV